ncbi:cupin domain-containing protein [Aquabacter spiritensis]|uniref:Cupin domain n=1 Tax=Aquabacter spiritensis TaxID=933073 RepID=A0A4R3M641_9HYPH|nr:cupin domain-containing protein [Aquabacter spiritensis]TCT06715.1 cupin domain [Aquabacter spiritensis]
MSQLVRSSDLASPAAGAGPSEIDLIEPGEFLSARFVDLPKGGAHAVEAAPGTDAYLYLFSGDAVLETAGRTQPFSAGAFLPLAEGGVVTITGVAGQSRLYVVTAKGPDLPGVPATADAILVDSLPVLDVPEQLKQRVFLVGKESIPSERSHGMIVKYTGDTWTKSHHHPNAESVFFFLTGNALVLANGAEHPVSAGDFVYFAVNDSHGLRSADKEGLSFLEFHAPSKFVTVHEAS